MSILTHNQPGVTQMQLYLEKRIRQLDYHFLKQESPLMRNGSLYRARGRERIWENNKSHAREDQTPVPFESFNFNLILS